MFLSGTGYRVALLCKLARLNVLIAGVTEAEARLADSGCIGLLTSTLPYCFILHGGDQRANGVTLMMRPPFAKSLTSWMMEPHL